VIKGDPLQLQQVFLNIILNAVQAMSKGGRLKISTKEEPGFIRIMFSDTGVGIPEENLDKIFDPFFTTKGVGEGTGLGLSICFGIIERHGGRIEVKSEVGEGSVFTVWLPTGDRSG
jgi:two-component system NtrC family sensor kinase